MEWSMLYGRPTQTWRFEGRNVQTCVAGAEAHFVVVWKKFWSDKPTQAIFKRYTSREMKGVMQH